MSSFTVWFGMKWQNKKLVGTLIKSTEMSLTIRSKSALQHILLMGQLNRKTNEQRRQFVCIFLCSLAMLFVGELC